MDIQAQHEIKDGRLEVTTTFRIPLEFIESGLYKTVAQMCGYREMTPSRQTIDGIEKVVGVANPQHPVDYMIDHLHAYIQEKAKSALVLSAQEQVKAQINQQFAQALES